MATSNASVNMTAEQLQEVLTKVLSTGIAEAKRMNPVEEDQYEKQMETKLRRELASIEHARVEEEAQKRKMLGCPHHVDKEGNPCRPQDGGKWITQGQVHSEGLLSLLCLRCNKTWMWKGTAEEISLALENGMKRWNPPARERVDAYLKSVEDRDMMFAKTAKERIDVLRKKLLEAKSA